MIEIEIGSRLLIAAVWAMALAAIVSGFAICALAARGHAEEEDDGGDGDDDGEPEAAPPVVYDFRSKWRGVA